MSWWSPVLEGGGQEVVSHLWDLQRLVFLQVGGSKRVVTSNQKLQGKESA